MNPEIVIRDENPDDICTIAEVTVEAFKTLEFQRGKYRFFFFSREEPRRHVHVRSPDGEAKFWLEPDSRTLSWQSTIDFPRRS